jgi:hypothetical protein
MPTSPTPAGQHDHSGARLTRHAIERFVERFHTGPADGVEPSLRRALARTRRLGRNPENGAVAVLGLVGDRILVAILQDDACTTVLTWPQFEPRLAEFGRARLPRKKGRMLRRLKEGRSEPPDSSQQ